MVLCACAAAFWFWTLLPARLFDAPESYVLEARDGTLLSARIASDGQWRFPPQATVPRKFRRALLVFEDKRFDQHSGIDGLAIARALRLNLERRPGGEWRQHAHHAACAPVAPPLIERSLTNKVAEALLALRIEASFGKDEILALYAAPCAVRRQCRRSGSGRLALLRP